jgi:thiol-disulfide isomerase/thioredoxin
MKNTHVVWSFVVLLASALLGGVFTVSPLYAVEAVEEADTVGVSIDAPEADIPETLTVPYEPVLSVFHSLTCPHCRKEMRFLDTMEEKYPELEIRRYTLPSTDNAILLDEFLLQYDAERYRGNVPLTFIGPYVFMGYDSDEGRGAEIESAIQEVLGEVGQEGGEDHVQRIQVPLLGVVDPSEYSLPMLAILLGFLDGFNVCSLGALVLIIGLTLRLQRRRAILLLGGSFIATTALVYGGLIVLWYKLFTYVGAYLNWMTVAVGLLSLVGGVYFLREYLRMRKQGAVCQFSESPWIQKITEQTGKAFENPRGVLGLFGAVIVFATVVAVVEFPCSAAVPVIFAGILADMGLSTLSYLSHIGLFVLFYMLDEIVIFGIAAYKLKLWMMNGTFTKWAVLGEAVLLIGIGVFYLGTLLKLF